MFRLNLRVETCFNKYDEDYYYDDFKVACSALRKLRNKIIAEYPNDFDNDREIDIDEEDCFKMHNNDDIEEFFVAIEPVDDVIRKDDDVSDILACLKVFCD